MTGAREPGANPGRTGILFIGLGHAAPAQKHRVGLQGARTVGLGNRHRSFVKVTDNIHLGEGGHSPVFNILANILAGRLS